MPQKIGIGSGLDGKCVLYLFQDYFMSISFGICASCKYYAIGECTPAYERVELSLLQAWYQSSSLKLFGWKYIFIIFKQNKPILHMKPDLLYFLHPQFFFTFRHHWELCSFENRDIFSIKLINDKEQKSLSKPYMRLDLQYCRLFFNCFFQKT